MERESKALGHTNEVSKSVSSDGERRYRKWIVLLSIMIPLVVALLFNIRIPNVARLGVLPPIYASINALTAVVLVLAVWKIKQGHRRLHEGLMKTAMLLSIVFLLLYIAYHATADPTKYGDLNHDGILAPDERSLLGLWLYVYYVILLSHIVLSVIVIPFVLITYVRAWTQRFDRHRKLARITFPIWLYVAITGVLVYVMIAPYYPD